MPKIILDKSTHTYYDENGQIVPGVTDILKDQGILVISPFSTGPELGAEVHSAVEAVNLGFYDPSAYSPEVAPYVGAYKVFQAATNFKPIGTEQIVYNELLGYAGMLDSTGHLNSKFSLVDLKSGAPNPATVVQVSAYWGAHPQKDKLTCYSLHLKADEKYRLNKIKPQDLWDAWGVFLGALSTYKFRVANGLI